jgi:hypothetical protein
VTTATERLTQALINIASQGLRPHCSDPGSSDLWLSDHPGGRREAVKLCAGCPVIRECRQAADARDERWHVWGGKDLHPPAEDPASSVRGLHSRRVWDQRAKASCPRNAPVE